MTGVQTCALPILPLQGPGLYKKGKEIYKRPAKTTVRERKEL